MVLDIHPQPKQPRIEVGIDRRSVELGRLDSSIFVGDIHTAMGSLASTVAQGLFLTEEETEFEFIYHFDDVDECKSSKGASPCGGQPPRRYLYSG